MKIYTKTGDQGTTSLFGGKRISKDELRIESYGTIDELNSHIGLLCSGNLPEELHTILQNIQSYLFVLGSHLATDPEKIDLKLPSLRPGETMLLESEIDRMESHLIPLKYFILPGGDTSASQAHLCRTVCRRAERRVVALFNNEKVEESIIIYLNRLSDYFFVLARYIAFINKSEEVYWKGE
jgi:cob(I)alamin adenosyltransferase